jgi:hypothetical protein
MNRNKTLSAAIIAALSIGGTVAQAGTFEMTAPVAGTTPKVATELFPTNPSAMPSTANFETTYTLDLGEDASGNANKVQKPFYVTFTLSGAEWNSEPSSASIELKRDGNPIASPTISFVGVYMGSDEPNYAQ